METNQKKGLTGIFAEDHSLVTYRPRWKKITGSVTATILLQQIIYYWDKNGEKPFYKFKERCSHKLYKEGDSWTEVLGFTRREFDGAISKLGYKKAKNRSEPHDKPVEYWTTVDRITYYTIHEANLHILLEQLYSVKDSPEHPCENGDCSLKHKSAFRKSANPPLDLKHKSAFRKSANPPLDHKDQRSSSKKKIYTERETPKNPASLSSPALDIFFENFSGVFLSKARQEDIVATATHLDAWKMTIWWWKIKEYRAENTENMLDYYLNKALPKFTQSAAGHAPQTDLFAAADHSGDDWQRILARLERRVNRPGFNTWLRPLTAELTDQTICLTVPDETSEYWLKENYITVIQEEAQQVLNFTPAITFLQTHTAAKV